MGGPVFGEVGGVYMVMFSELTLRNQTIKNRILFTSPVTGFAYKGRLTAKLENYYLERAKGGAAVIELEPGLEYDEGQAAEWSDFAEQVHAHGAKLLAAPQGPNFRAALATIRRAGLDGVALYADGPEAISRLCGIAADALGQNQLMGLHVKGDLNCGGMDRVDYLAVRDRNASRKGRAPVAYCANDPEPAQCEAALREGYAKLMCLSRQLVCDPYWPVKAELGMDDAIRRWDLLCEEPKASPARIRCALNPYLGHEGDYSERSMPRAARSKAVVVVGGGPAGMQAAITCAQRGHDVLLWEPEDELGGRLRSGGHRNAARWMVSEMKRNQVDVRLGIPLTPAYIAALKPDAVVMATHSAVKETLAPSLRTGKIPVLQVDDCENSIGQGIRNGFHVAIGI